MSVEGSPTTRTVHDEVNDLAQSIYGSFLASGEVMFEDGEPRYVDDINSGEVTFGEVCNPASDRHQVDWCRASFVDGKLTCFSAVQGKSGSPLRTFVITPTEHGEYKLSTRVEFRRILTSA